MKKAVVLILFLLVSGLFAITEAGDVSMNQTKGLLESTHADDTLAHWDSVQVIIRDYTGTAVDTISLDSIGVGWWAGSWDPIAPGNYNAHRCGWLNDLRTCTEENFSVYDTAAFFGVDLSDEVEAIAMYWGAKEDGYYQILYPADGSASKDSVGIFDDGDTHKATIYFHHSNVETVVDSITYRKW